MQSARWMVQFLPFIDGAVGLSHFPWFPLLPQEFPEFPAKPVSVAKHPVPQVGTSYATPGLNVNKPGFFSRWIKGKTVKTATIATHLTLVLILMLAATAGAQNVDYNFHWSPSPTFDYEEGALSLVVAYEVWVKKGSAPEERVAVQHADTTYALSAEPGVVQRIRVRGVDAGGRFSEMSEWSDPIYFEANRSGEGPPEMADLRSNYPNPFNPETNIVYGVPETVQNGDPVRLDIYNLAGLRIRTLEVDPTPGWHEITWDGKNDRGQTQSTGMYVTRFTVGTMVTTNKMTMVK
jgi:hypothetical protein